MAGSFVAVDLSQLPVPQVIADLDYEVVLGELIADLQQRWPAYSALLESDPAMKILEVAAYRELLLRQRVNDAARAVMLPYATGADLDNLAALLGVQRLVIDPGNPSATPPRPRILETDADFRARAQLAFEGFSTAGPEGAYLFHVRGAHSDVKDASVVSPEPGEVVVTVLSRTGSGAPSAEVLDAVRAALDDDVRPLTDHVVVQAAEVVPFEVAAELTYYPGPDAAVVEAAARAALAAYLSQIHRLGHDVARSGIMAALHQPGVQRVELLAPGDDIVIAWHEAAFASAVNISGSARDV